MTETIDLTLSRRLREATHDTHDRLDSAIMAADAFGSVDGYCRFVTMQWTFHRHIDALYDSAVLAALLPGLATRRRFDAITQDLADLGLPRPLSDDPVAFRPGDLVDLPTALGWLYVAEGSNLGAALLRKQAAKLGLSDAHGARHLAPAAEGPAAHWRLFVAALDAVPLNAEDNARAIDGAEAAFAHVQAQVDGWRP